MLLFWGLSLAVYRHNHPSVRLAQATKINLHELISAQVFDVRVCKIPADRRGF